MGLASTKIGSYDALSSAFNPISKTFLLAGLDADDNVIGAELNGHGVRISAEQKIIDMPATYPARYNRVESSHTGPRWMNVISRKFGAIWGQVVQTTTTEGGSSTAYPPPGSGGNPPPPPGGGGNPPPPSSKKAWVWADIPTSQPASHNTFAVAGWAIDENVTNSVTGIDAVHIYAYPNCVGCGGTPVMLGGADLWNFTPGYRAGVRRPLHGLRVPSDCHSRRWGLQSRGVRPQDLEQHMDLQGGAHHGPVSHPAPGSPLRPD